MIAISNKSQGMDTVVPKKPSLKVKNSSTKEHESVINFFRGTVDFNSKGSNPTQ